MTRSGNASARLRLQLVPSVGEQAFSAGSSAPAGWFCGSTARLAAGSCWFSAVPQRMGAALDPERKDLVRRKKIIIIQEEMLPYWEQRCLKTWVTLFHLT